MTPQFEIRPGKPPLPEEWQGEVLLTDPAYLFDAETWERFLGMLTGESRWLGIRYPTTHHDLVGGTFYPFFCWSPPDGSQYYLLERDGKYVGHVPCDSDILAIIPSRVFSTAPHGLALPAGDLPSVKNRVLDWNGYHLSHG